MFLATLMGKYLCRIEVIRLVKKTSRLRDLRKSNNLINNHKIKIKEIADLFLMTFAVIVALKVAHVSPVS